LVVFTPQMRFMRDGGSFRCTPSRFVTEIPRHLLPPVGGRYARY